MATKVQSKVRRHKRAKNKNAGTRTAPKLPTLKKAHTLMSALFAERAIFAQDASPLTTGLPEANAAAAGEKTVSFTLTNVGCIAVITSSNISFSLTGGSKVGHPFPVGANDLFYAVQGPPNEAFAINVEGGSLDIPINRKLGADGKAGGSRQLTVA